MPRRIVVIAGTRPECIKLAPVLKELKSADWAEGILLGTGQHGNVVADLMASLGMEFDVIVKQPGEPASLARQFARLTENLAVEFERLEPDLVLVQGDTSSALAGAMAAFYGRVPVGHIEAGLRTGDTRQPFPEEFNRQAIARAAVLHFAPTNAAADNLVAEGIPLNSIEITGNTGIDALQHFLPLATKSMYPQGQRRMVLVTMHRRENLGRPITSICLAINELHDRYQDLEFVIPVHPNPAVRSLIENSITASGRIHLLPPQGYLEMISLLRASTLVLTDSGGLQEWSAP